MTDDLAARIAALVDDQLEQEPTGYDYSVGTEQCRCGDEWHGLPVTQAMRRMRWAYGLGHTDAMDGYTIDQDTSPIMCPGSDIQGPLRATLSDGRFRDLMAGSELALREMAPVMMRGNPWMSGPTIEDGDPVGFEDIHTGEIHRYRWGQQEVVMTPRHVQLLHERMESAMEHLRTSMGSFADSCRSASAAIDRLGEDPMIRALPRPSSTPPFWATDHRRRGRAGRNHL